MVVGKYSEQGGSKRFPQGGSRRGGSVSRRWQGNWPKPPEKMPSSSPKTKKSKPNRSFGSRPMVDWIFIHQQHFLKIYNKNPHRQVFNRPIFWTKILYTRNTKDWSSDEYGTKLTMIIKGWNVAAKPLSLFSLIHGRRLVATAERPEVTLDGKAALNWDGI